MMEEALTLLDGHVKTLNALLIESSLRLKDAGLETPRLDAEVLICRALGMSREAFWRDPHREIDAADLSRCEAWIHRRERREPLAYILEEREFWSRRFRVTRDVLIPRSESELIIERLLENIGPEARQRPLKGLDLCTGSGALAIVAALELPRARITGVDVSSSALEIANENGRYHGVDVRLRWVRRDLLNGLELEEAAPESFDFILCNPPYLGASDMQALPPEIARFEPAEALDGGPDGTRFYPEIIKTAARWLKPAGLLLMEMGCEQGGAVRSLLETSRRLTEITVIQDYTGRDRLVSARMSKGV